MIVGDSSALISLCIVDCLDYLIERFGSLYVPVSVYDELTKLPRNQSEVLKIFLKERVVAVKDKRLKTLWLGAGESEAIDLYFELKADLLLVDDQRAKSFAIMNNIHTIGSLGVLLLAKEDGKIESIKPLLDRLTASGIYLSTNLAREVLIKAKESSF